MTSISLPVAGLLGLLSGMIFNLVDAVILVSFASSIGAVLSFWLSRYLFRNYFKHKTLIEISPILFSSKLIFK